MVIFPLAYIHGQTGVRLRVLHASVLNEILSQLQTIVPLLANQLNPRVHNEHYFNFVITKRLVLDAFGDHEHLIVAVSSQVSACYAGAS
jgi:hypothetical protein